MPDIHGRLGKLAINTGGGYIDVAGIKTIEMKVDQSTVDVTDHDSGQWEEFIVGRKNITFSVSGNYNEDDAGQELVLATGLFAGTIVLCRFRAQTGTGFKEYFGSAIIKNVSDSSPNDAVNELSFDVQMTGTITRQNQP